MGVDQGGARLAIVTSCARRCSPVPTSEVSHNFRLALPLLSTLPTHLTFNLAPYLWLPPVLCEAAWQCAGIFETRFRRSCRG
jgi:hypothetical protein